MSADVLLRLRYVEAALFAPHCGMPLPLLLRELLLFLNFIFIYFSLHFIINSELLLLSTYLKVDEYILNCFCRQFFVSSLIFLKLRFDMLEAFLNIVHIPTYNQHIQS